MSSYLWQIIAVAVILIACLLYMVLSVRRRFKEKSGSGACCGCALSSTCNKPREKVDCTTDNRGK